MEAIESGEVERVITSVISRISRSVRDFAVTVERIVDENEVGLHILDMGIDLEPDEHDPYTRVLDRGDGVRRTGNRNKRDNTCEGIATSREQGKWHGRPPFGFDVGPEGYLVPNDYETALIILDELDKGASKRELGRRTGVGRSAVRHVANDRERYVGEPPEPAASA